MGALRDYFESDNKGNDYDIQSGRVGTAHHQTSENEYILIRIMCCSATLGGLRINTLTHPTSKMDHHSGAGQNPCL